MKGLGTRRPRPLHAGRNLRPLRRLLLPLLPLPALFTMPLTIHATEAPDFETVRRIDGAPRIEIWVARP